MADALTRRWSVVRVGDRIWFTEERNGYTVQAVSATGRFVACTKPFAARQTVIYSMLDFERCLRGVDDSIGNSLGYETRAACEHAVGLFESGQFSLSRRRAPIAICIRRVAARLEIDTAHQLTRDEESDVLRFNPWDDRDNRARTLRSGFARCRKPHACAICFGPIAVGTRVWAKTEQDDGRVKTFRFCAECCWCIAHRYEVNPDDGGDHGFQRMYARWDLGRARAERR